MLSGSTGLAVAASFSWGVLSIVLSPCHLASIPLIVGFINRKPAMTAASSARISLVFSMGILFSTVVIGIITALLGRMAGDAGIPFQIIISVVIILFGLHLIEVITLPLPDRDGSKFAGINNGLFSALMLGIVMGAALGPCTFAFLAPLIGIALTSSGGDFFTVMLFTLYGFGHALVIVLAGTFSGALQKFLNWNEKSRGLVLMKKLCGVLVAGAGIYTGYSALRFYVNI